MNIKSSDGRASIGSHRLFPYLGHEHHKGSEEEVSMPRVEALRQLPSRLPFDDPTTVVEREHVTQFHRFARLATRGAYASRKAFP